ncbi:hypothetical protein [uncultured Roseobacter sp.]|uniref:hypothetical protein n=1 Tax=uncultured Roseobacter sp. TaxID=114847 RepID=UPI002601EB11|nr:hypothetical protein [uncultured Roseobacter sp.]
MGDAYDAAFKTVVQEGLELLGYTRQKRDRTERPVPAVDQWVKILQSQPALPPFAAFAKF